MATFLELKKNKLNDSASASFLFRVHSRLPSVHMDVADNLLSANTPVLQ